MRWNGERWLPTATRPAWDPPWSQSDSVAVLISLFVVPAALAAGALGVVVMFRLHAIGASVVAMVTATLWPLAGGALIRPWARWREVPRLSAVFTGVVCFAYLGAMFAGDNDRNGKDDAAAVGLMFVGPIIFVSSVGLVALGRLIARGAVGVVRRCGREQAVDRP